MKNYILILIGFFALLSCGSEQDNANVVSENGETLVRKKQPLATGLVNEVYVLCDSTIWQGPVGEYIRSEMEAPLQGLPQQEAMLDVYQFQIEGATKDRYTHKNIIKIEKKELNNARLNRQEDSWAKGQVVYEFQGASSEELLAVFQREMPGLKAEIIENERKKLITEFNIDANPELIEKIKTKYNISMAVPYGTYAQEQDLRPDFVWAQREQTGPKGKYQIQQGLFIYEYPYDNDSTFTYDFLVNKRDSILKYNVPGSKDDQYLQTNKGDEIGPYIKEVNFNDEYGIEMRGQFRMENGYMGGPFISLTTVDKKRNKVVTIEGYVFSPGTSKRDYLKEMEALIYSAKFVE